MAKSKKPAVKVGPAKHGQGLFATKRFRPGETIGEVTGTIYTDPDYGSNYCVDLGDDGSLEPGEPFRFLNHCCEPNAKLFLVYEDDTPVEERTVFLDALKNIQPGAEILIDYEWPADAAMKCGCGSENCRGWIVAPEDMHLLKT